VMALYLLIGGISRGAQAAIREGDQEPFRAELREARWPRPRVMLDHARKLLAKVGYGTAEGPLRGDPDLGPARP
jgi:hypothetical protein